MKKNQITILDEVFDLMNQYFFNKTLPKPQITIVRAKGARGYFLANSFVMKSNNNGVHEIALNPELFNKTEAEILSTLLHEMCHLWQKVYGKKIGKNNYHNKEFSQKMKEVGLQTYDIYTKKETGTHVTHYIVENSEYSSFLEKYIKENIILLRAEPINEIKKDSKHTTKIKYECEICKSKVWGKSGLKLSCDDCHCEMEEGQ